MPKSTKIEREQYYAQDRKEWREWLTKNHATSPGVWLIQYKKNSGKPTVTYEEAVEEALCFGWIDSRLEPLTSDSYRLSFAPRQPGSWWARSNKQRVEKLIQNGLMTEAGLKVIEAAKKDGSWTLMDSIEDLVVPEDVRKALAANPTAEKNYNSYTNSIKKQILYWIATAKRPETRAQRIAQVVTAAAQNKIPFQDTPQKKGN